MDHLFFFLLGSGGPKAAKREGGGFNRNCGWKDGRRGKEREKGQGEEGEEGKAARQKRGRGVEVGGGYGLLTLTSQ